MTFGLNYNLLTISQNSNYPDGVRTMGGYSTGIIANELYVFHIPNSIKSEDAASMLCAGLTMFSPLIHNGAGPGKKVGIVGIGGLVRSYISKTYAVQNN